MIPTPFFLALLPQADESPDSVETATQWLDRAEKRTGSWWESWTKWCAKRSGKKIDAPETVGSDAYPPLCDAPGTYVREVVT